MGLMGIRAELILSESICMDDLRAACGCLAEGSMAGIDGAFSKICFGKMGNGTAAGQV